jgi:hypothetical protein
MIIPSNFFPHGAQTPNSHNGAQEETALKNSTLFLSGCFQRTVELAAKNLAELSYDTLHKPWPCHNNFNIFISLTMISEIGKLRRLHSLVSRFAVGVIKSSTLQTHAASSSKKVSKCPPNYVDSRS